MVKVRSKGTLIDGDFSINDGEVKELPKNYKNRPGILNHLGRMLEVIGDEEVQDAEEKEDEELHKRVHEVKQEKLLGFKPEVYLDQNSSVVRKTLRETKFSEEQLDLLAECENGDKCRKSVLKLIRKKLKERGK